MFDDFFGPERARKRTLGIRDKQILYERAKERCENCASRMSFTEMQVGHKTAHSRGGATQLRNLVSLCYKCNKLQGTDSWATFRRKQGKVVGATATTKRAAKKTAKKASKKTVKKPVKKVGKKTTRKVAKKAGRKVARKTTTATAKPRRRKEEAPFDFFRW